MDLILWRHAEALDPEGLDNDLSRPLTPRGEKHAARMAQWLDRQLPEGTRILSSPAVRAEQTVRALQRKYKVRDALSPGASVHDVLETAQWPDAKYPVLLVGHQPFLGDVAAQLLGMAMGSCPIRKGRSGGCAAASGTVWIRRSFCRSPHLKSCDPMRSHDRPDSRFRETELPVGFLPGQHFFLEQMR